MKKILGIAIIGLLMPLFGGELNLQDRKLVENFGKRVLAQKIDTYDQDKLGEWALRTYHYDKYRKTQNDEFEFDDAKAWALKDFKDHLSKVPPFDKDEIYHAYVRTEFNKYDFKTQSFPVEALTSDSYLSFQGENKIVQRTNATRVTFTNATSDANIIKMDKQAAKEFIKKRKNSGGYINRKLLAHYTYKITDFKEGVRTFDAEYKRMNILFTGKIVGVEFLDKKTKKVIYSVDYTVFPDKKTAEVSPSNY